MGRTRLVKVGVYLSALLVLLVWMSCPAHVYAEIRVQCDGVDDTRRLQDALTDAHGRETVSVSGEVPR